MRGKVFLALIHHPVYDKNNDIVTTSITNFDIHDLARSARTFGVEKYFLIHPMESQRHFSQRIIDHWTEGFGSTYNSTRKDAFQIIELLPDISSMIEYIEANYGSPPLTIATSAKIFPHSVTFPEMKTKIAEEEGNYLILLGTGWGLHTEIVENCGAILEPIWGPSHYNHLSVRAAGAIILDRLLGIPSNIQEG